MTSSYQPDHEEKYQPDFDEVYEAFIEKDAPEYETQIEVDYDP